MVNDSSKWTFWLAGIIASTLTGAIFFMGNNVVANEKSSIARDEKIEDKLTQAVIEQKEVNQGILIALKEIQTDLKYIKAK